MKRIYPVLMLMFVNFFYSQDTRIFENSWYLTNVIVNGVNNFPPNGTMDINFPSPANFYAHACNTMSADVTFENNNTSFSASNYNYTLDFCNNPAAESFQSIYFPFFLDGNDPTALTFYHFTYVISEILEVKTLTITSMFNQQAVYSNVRLSSNNYEKSEVRLSPNPSKDFVDINLSNAITTDTIVAFFNEIGQICKTVNLNSTTAKIDLADLSSGIYLVRINMENETITKKLIKI